MYKICIYAKPASQRKSLRFLMGRFPDVMGVVGECKTLDECLEWFKNNDADCLMTVLPPTCDESKIFVQEVQRKFPQTKIDGFTTLRIRQLVEFHEFVEAACDEALPRPKKIPDIFPRFGSEIGYSKVN